MTAQIVADALIIGGGPAGLMAADALLSAGHSVLLADAKPSLGRKFLMAGKSGLNLTRMQDVPTFLGHYDTPDHLRPMIDALPPEAIRTWALGLGQDTFTGSTLRLFPKSMKASPLLRAWLARLDDMGLTRQTRWRWTGWQDACTLFDTPQGVQRVTSKATILALGGASWARLGSDGAWADILSRNNVALSPFAASNAGVHVQWSAHMTQHFGTPLKNIALSAGDRTSRGEAVISARGLEGGGVYPLTPALRHGAPLSLDLRPDLDMQRLADKLRQPRGKQSLSNTLRKRLGLSPAALALVMEFGRPLPTDPDALARTLKRLPIRHAGLRPMDEAISTAGGVAWDALDETLMLKARPGTFCAGEMIDWDAPTGGYLLTACLATGLWAGQNAARLLGSAERQL